MRKASAINKFLNSKGDFNKRTPDKTPTCECPNKFGENCCLALSLLAACLCLLSGLYALAVSAGMNDPDDLVRLKHNCSQVEYCQRRVVHSNPEIESCITSYCSVRSCGDLNELVKKCGDDTCVINMKCQGAFFRYRRRMRSNRKVVQYSSGFVFAASFVCLIATALTKKCLQISKSKHEI